MLVVLAVLATTGPASAAEPRLTVSKSALARSLKCVGPVANAKRTPIMLVTGTGASGDEAYLIGKGAFDREGRGVCRVNFPDFTTADVQVSVQYLVYGIRTMRKRAGRDVAVFGISQGGLLPRVALTYWPSLRAQVSDVLAAAGTQHGTNTAGFSDCRRAPGCIPAGWQQRAGSSFLKALNAQRDETPGPTAWTTVRSRDDEVVQPQTGRKPTSSLEGATNVLIQSVCRGRKVTHIGTAVDSVSFALFRDAITHRGPAKLSRIPKSVCSQPYAPGLDPATTAALIGGADGLTGGRSTSQPRVTREPVVRAIFKKKVE